MSLSTDIATAVIDSTISALTHADAPIYATAIAATALVALLALRKRRPRDTRDTTPSPDHLERIEALLQSIDTRLADIQRHIDSKHRLPDKPSSPANGFPRIIPHREDDQ